MRSALVRPPEHLPRALARRIYPVARRLYYSPGLRIRLGGLIDSAHGAVRRREPLEPPPSLRFVGRGDFAAIGAEFVDHFRTLAGLRPDDRVLDVGCGVGRVAVPLTDYLDGGSYEGFDVVPSLVEWCSENITTRFPHFRFQVADVHNRQYNRRGSSEAADFVFPYEDDEFDFAFATSVFTHMLPRGFANYAHELARVLAPGGRLLATFFLLNDESDRLLRAGAGKVDLRHRERDEAAGIEFATTDRRTPEYDIGLPEPFVLETLSSVGLEPRKAIHYGYWPGRGTGASFQDIVVADRG